MTIVTAAGDLGIYVSVMLFEGFSLHLTAAPDNVEGHPFHAANNVNGIGIASFDDLTCRLERGACHGPWAAGLGGDGDVSAGFESTA
jgi:hypothetical protein